MFVNEANKIVLVISIDLGNTKDDITVRAKDSPEALAKIFCAKHGLDASIQSSITQQIKANLEQHKPQRKPNLAQNSFLKKTQRKPTPQSPSGNRLYQNAFKIQAKKEKLSNQINSQRQENELKGATFKPKIIRSTNESVVNSQKVLEKQTKIQRIKTQLEQKEMAECTFKPKIRSQTPAEPSTDRFSKLYQDAQNRRERSKQLAESFYEENYTFTPKTLSKKRINTEKSIERLKGYYYNATKELNTRKRTYNSSTDSGLFKPSIKRGPKVKRETDVWSDLYSRRTKSSRRPFQTPPKSNVNPKSLRILEKLKMAKFHRIFKALNPKEGKINYETIVSGDLDCDLLKVINPLVEEIKKSKEELTFEEFCAALETLMKKLTPEEKNYLVVGSQKSSKLNLSLGSISPINKRYSKEEVTTETDFEEVLKTPEKTFRNLDLEISDFP